MTQHTFHEESESAQTGFEDTLATQTITTNEGFSLRRIFDFPLFHWKAFFLFLGCCFGVGINWLMTADIFDVPADVVRARIESITAHDRYTKNRPYWHIKEKEFVERLHTEIARKNNKEALELLQKIQGETLLAFLVASLGIHEERLSDFTITPQKGPGGLRLILSKFERGIWPLKVLLTLELEITVKKGRLAIAFARLRRGSKEVSRGLSSAYFGAELEPLRNHELFQLPIS